MLDISSNLWGTGWDPGCVWCVLYTGVRCWSGESHNVCSRIFLPTKQRQRALPSENLTKMK